MKTTSVLVAALAILLGPLCPREAAADASFRIEIFDDPDFGFNDPTPLAPAGGNPGTTLGEQRLNALREAVQIWSATIDSPIEIVILTKWWDFGGGIVGSAGVAFWMRDFAGAPRANTWYPPALANKLAGMDFCPPPEGGDCGGDYDMFLDFYTDHPFYLGLDEKAAEGEFDLVSLSLHEIGHGLGFVMWQSSPQKLRESNIIYQYFLEDHYIDRTFPQMSFFERAVGALAGRYLHWVGPRGLAEAASLTAGRDPAGHLLLYGHGATNVSLVHLSPDVSPNNFMEVFLEGSPRDPTLAYSMLTDLGWGEAICPGDCNADGRVSLSELLRAVRMALRQESLVRCAILEVDADGSVRVAELIRAVKSSLNGCKSDDSARTSSAQHQASITVVRRAAELNRAFPQAAGEGFEAQLSGPAGGVVGRGGGARHIMRSVVDSGGRVRAGCGVGMEPGLE